MVNSGIVNALSIPEKDRAAIEARFWPKMDRSGGADACHEWQAWTDADGYGALKIRKKKVQAHRIAYVLAFGPLDKGEEVLHSCDNPPCCNEIHLHKGDNAMNQAEKVSRGRQSRGDAHGSRTKRAVRPRGEMHRGAKVTADEVSAMRAEHATGLFTLGALGIKYGLGTSQIRRIVKREKWGHV